MPALVQQAGARFSAFAWPCRFIETAAQRRDLAREFLFAERDEFPLYRVAADGPDKALVCTAGDENQHLTGAQ